MTMSEKNQMLNLPQYV